MRPTVTPQDELRHPLNRLLGTESGVRILRSMCEVRIPLSSVEIAESSSLSEAGARTALSRLVRSGMVIREGRGRQQLYSLRKDHLTDALEELYRQERFRYATIEKRLRVVIRRLPIPPRVVWLGPPTKDGRIELCFLAKSQDVGPIRTALQQAVNEAEREFDIVIDVRGYSRADSPSIDAGRTIFTEPVPSKLEALSHVEQEARAAIRARRIAELIETRPDITHRALRHLERIMNEEHGMANNDIREWMTILQTYSPIRLAAFLRSDSDRSQRLRQSSPITAVLDTEELAAIDRGDGL